MAPHALDLAPFWARLSGGFFAGALTWLVAADYGSAVVRRFLNIRHPIGRLGVAATVGYAAIGCAIAILGLVGEINRFTAIGLLACAVLGRLGAYARVLRSLGELRYKLGAALRSADGATKASLIVIGIAAITGIVNAALPAAWWDPIAYHLPIVSAALRQGTFSFDPFMVQSAFPHLAEAAATPAYALAGSAGAAMATLGTGLCIALLVWALGDSLRERCGAIAAMLCTSSALWAWLAPSFYVDVPFAMFVVAGLLVALQFGSAADDSIIPASKWGNAHAAYANAFAAGALCGAAASVKYSGLGAIVIIGATVLWLSGRQRWRQLLPFIGGCASVAGLWYVRSWLLTGDPVYPFAALSFSHVATVQEFGMRYVDMTKHWCGGGTSFADVVALPYRLLADPRSFCGDPGLALRVGVVFALVAIALSSRARMLALIGLALTMFWFATSQQWRFLLPAVFIYCAIVAAGIAACGPRLRTWAGVAMMALGCLTVLVNWSPAWRSQASASIVPALPYINGSADAGAYLDARLETFAAAKWLADFGFEGANIVALDDVRDYYLPAGTVWANPYYQQAVALDWSATTKERYQPLIALGKTYLVVNENEAYLRRTPTGVDWSAFERDRHSLREVFSRNGVSVFDMSGLR